MVKVFYEDGLTGEKSTQTFVAGEGAYFWKNTLIVSREGRALSNALSDSDRIQAYTRAE